MAPELPIKTHVSIEAQTAAIPRVPAAVTAVTDARTNPAPGGDARVTTAEPTTEAAAPAPDAEVAALEPSTEIAREVSVEDIYEAGLAKLEALHHRWAAAMAEVRQSSASGELGQAAA